MLSPKQVLPIARDGASEERHSPSLEAAPFDDQGIDLRGLQAQLRELIQHERLSIRLQDGSRYEGMLLDGLPHGDGVWTQADGTALQAHWQAGELIGKLHIAYPDGSDFSGQVLAGLAHGQGSLRRKDGLIHEGQYQAGRPQGLGKLTWPDGRKF
ncbi:MAG: hypothetical protein ACO3X1_11540, partial [Burkholderiaceae bacterium]